MASFATPTMDGLRVTFDNGWTVSVQWGQGNYCENRDLPISKFENHDSHPSPNAEVAIWHLDEPLHHLGAFDEVVGWLDPDRVILLMAAVQSGDISQAEQIARA